MGSFPETCDDLKYQGSLNNQDCHNRTGLLICPTFYQHNPGLLSYETKEKRIKRTSQPFIFSPNDYINPAI